MYGSATAAMEVSSTSMNVASITASAINQGFTVGALCVVCAGVIPSTFKMRPEWTSTDAFDPAEVLKMFWQPQIGFLVSLRYSALKVSSSQTNVTWNP